MKISVVTTFNKSGLEQYGQRMIESFEKHWPDDIDLYVYAEDCQVITTKPNVIVKDLHAESSELVTFKNRWKNEPKAKGMCPWPERRLKDWHKTFKWDAIRFSHKVYAIFHCAKICNSDVLLWMDADMICHSPITFDFIKSMIPTEYDLCYLGRERKWPECGLYSINLNSRKGQLFLKEFQRVYDNAEDGIFKMEEWHDSYVFEEVRKVIDPLSLNWSAGIIKGEGHPLINSKWGAYLDHLKGDRKDLGHSKKTDLIVNRTEGYWKKI